MENCGNGTRTHRRVVLFPLPFQGHINPMLQLANILHTHGFKITVIHAEYNSPNYSNYPHFTFKSIKDNFSKIADELATNPDGSYFINYLNRSCVDSFKECLSGLLDKEAVACLIADSGFYFTQAVADELNLPRMALRTSSLAASLVYGALPFYSNKDCFNLTKEVFYEENIMSPDDTSNFKKTKSSKPVLNLEERVPEIPLLKVKDIIKMRIKGQEDPTGKLLANMLKQTKASSGIIWNSFTELEEPELKKILQYFPVPCFLIGPFHKCFPASSSSLFEPDRSSMSWLDHQSPSSVLYISFGSTAQLEEQQFLEVAHGLADSKQPFLWVMRPGFIKGLEGTEPLPKWFLDLVGERGRIVKWAPQPEVLAHKAIGAFWTHNGWNSTLESICEGVPMICSPFWGDQPLDARYVSDVLKIGIYLENGWAREEIASAIRRVMVEEERDEIKKRTKCLKEKVNSSLSKGGSSYESLETLIGYISSF